MPTLTATLPTGATLTRTTEHAYRFVVAGLVRHSGQWEAITWTKGTPEQAGSLAAKERDVREWTLDDGRTVRGFTPRGAFSAFKGGANEAANIAKTQAAATFYAEVAVLPVSR